MIPNIEQEESSALLERRIRSHAPRPSEVANQVSKRIKGLGSHRARLQRHINGLEEQSARELQSVHAQEQQQQVSMNEFKETVQFLRESLYQHDEVMGLRGVLRKFEDAAERFRKSRGAARDSIVGSIRGILQNVERSNQAIVKVGPAFIQANRSERERERESCVFMFVYKRVYLCVRAL